MEIMLRGVTDRPSLDDKVNRVIPSTELAIIFNDPEIEFENFFAGHRNGDEDLRSLDPNEFINRPESFLKGDSPFPPNVFTLVDEINLVVTPLQSNGRTTRLHS